MGFFCTFAAMKQVKIFHQYAWIINTLKSNKRVTFEELKRLWILDEVADGKPLYRSTFNRHRDDIQKMFGIVIDCDMKTYEYYIGNPNALSEDSIEQWLYSTMTVHGMLSESTAVKDRVVLENVATGLEYLQTIIEAINTNHCLLLGYQKFGQEGYEKIVSPYAIKLFHQRWYMLAKTQEDSMRLYALDRIQSLSITEEIFKMPADFSPQEYFSEYFGVLTDSSVPMAHIVIRAHNWTPNYLRTLPLHQSQRELASTPDYTDFSYNLRPTSDFIGQLLSQGSGIEVLEPQDLRQKMRELVEESLKRYQGVND